LYAANPKESYFKLSEPGTIEVLGDGRTRFVPSANGKHRYLIADVAEKARVRKAYTEIASTKPSPPAGRGRPAQVNQVVAPAKAPDR
jgi:purine nucleosidase